MGNQVILDKNFHTRNVPDKEPMGEEDFSIYLKWMEDRILMIEIVLKGDEDQKK